VALIAANGFFVAAEFSLVTARRTRIEQLAAGGNRAAIAVERAQRDPNRFISACQLGITVASLALGWIGEATIAQILTPVFDALIPHDIATFSSHAIASPIAFVVMTFSHITLGEQVPKMIALEAGEQAALVTVLPTNVVGTIFRPFIKMLEIETDLVLRMLGMRWHPESGHAYSREDLKLMIRSSRAAGALESDPDHLVERALDFAQLAAHHIMVPRTELVAIPVDISMADLASIMARYHHSRYPVYDGTLDNLVGILWPKDVAVVFAESGAGSPNVRQLMRPAMFVPETMHADRLLTEMRRNGRHEAIVIDEFGAIAGLITLRDIMDRLAGEVRDEAEPSRPPVEVLPDGSILVDGLMLIKDLEQELGIDFGAAEYDTLGGFIFGKLGRRPVLGDTVAADGRVLVVEELDGLRVSRARICERVPANEATAPSPDTVGS
jgi:CBS domain containing-hemolysin-like protein